MFISYIVVTILAAAANIFSATLDFIRYEPILINMAKVERVGIVDNHTGNLKSSGRARVVNRYRRACGWNRRRRQPRPVFCRRNHHSLARARLLVRPGDRVPSPGNRRARGAISG